MKIETDIHKDKWPRVAIEKIRKANILRSIIVRYETCPAGFVEKIVIRNVHIQVYEDKTERAKKDAELSGIDRNWQKEREKKKGERAVLYRSVVTLPSLSRLLPIGYGNVKPSKKIVCFSAQ